MASSLPPRQDPVNLEMPTLVVLVHSPLVGPSTWDALAEAFPARDYTVLVPDLTASLSEGPPYWSRQIDAIRDCAATEPVILVGHSGAGALLAAASGHLEHVRGYLFVDAGLPHPGQSWMETAPPEVVRQIRAMVTDGWLPPWSEWWGRDGLAELLPDPIVRERFAAACPRLPFAMFEEHQPFTPGWPDAPCAYLRLSQAYREQAQQAKALGWPVSELELHHLAVLTSPDLVLDPLLELMQKL